MERGVGRIYSQGRGCRHRPPQILHYFLAPAIENALRGPCPRFIFLTFLEKLVLQAILVWQGCSIKVNAFQKNCINMNTPLSFLNGLLQTLDKQSTQIVTFPPRFRLRCYVPELVQLMETSNVVDENKASNISDLKLSNSQAQLIRFIQNPR